MGRKYPQGDLLIYDISYRRGNKIRKLINLYSGPNDFALRIYSKIPKTMLTHFDFALIDMENLRSCRDTKALQIRLPYSQYGVTQTVANLKK